MSVEASAAWPKNQRGFKLRKNSVADFGSAIPLQSSIENAGMQKNIFNNSQLALRVMDAVRWPSGVTCIYCGCKVVSAHGRDKLHYRCARCAKLFDFSTGTVLADTDLLPQDLLLALYTFCTSKYRYSAFLSLQCHQGLSTRSIETLWATVRSRCRSYRGYKNTFGRLLQVEMPETPRRVSGSRKQKLVVEGKHQSQKTIHPMGCLLLDPLPIADTRTLQRTECLLRLLIFDT
jgi:hypothetical protein